MSFETLTAARAEDVWDALAQYVRAGSHQEIPVTEAVGAVLTGDIRAERDFPPFNRAVMDGYAVRTADFDDGPATLHNTGLVRAGMCQTPPVEPGTCVRINTGAAVPEGADAVVMVEQSQDLGDGRVTLNDMPKAGQYIDAQGSTAHADDLLVRGGTRIGPGTVAAIIAAGFSHVNVFQRPRVALLTTGDELVAPGQSPEHSQIHDSNTAALTGLVASAGAELAAVDLCADDPAILRDTLWRGLDNELLCVVGGMSKGTHDLVPGLLEELGVEWLVKRMHIKPGKPTRIGRSPKGGWVIGLPGNPVSCVVIFTLFARTILDGLQGLPIHQPPHLVGRLEADIPANGERPMYQPAEWSCGPGGDVCVNPLVWHGSGNPFGFAVANALIFRPQRAGPSPRGDAVLLVPIGQAR